jgi:hypothetical protein
MERGICEFQSGQSHDANVAKSVESKSKTRTIIRALVAPTTWGAFCAHVARASSEGAGAHTCRRGR